MWGFCNNKKTPIPIILALRCPGASYVFTGGTPTDTWNSLAKI
jgi:hypothetical protein